MPEKNFDPGKPKRPQGEAYIYYFWKIDNQAIAPEHEEDGNPNSMEKAPVLAIGLLPLKRRQNPASLIGHCRINFRKQHLIKPVIGWNREYCRC